MNPSVTHPARSDAWPDDLYITEQLQTRRETDADYPLQMDALRDLAGRMLDAPEEVLPRFVERAQEITQGVSAGLSILEETAGVFRWRCLKGLLAPFENATTPRNYSPCGVTLDENRPVLCRHPERFYSWVAEAGIAIPEVLLVPLHYAGAKPIGTLWIVSEREGHFHAGHAKAASELARFAGIALRIRETQQLLQNAVEQQETLTREMAHRVKNLFTIAQSLVGLTAKTTFSKDQMAETLNGRFYALARAHALVRKGFGGTSAAEAQDLRTLLVAIVEPHNTAETDRFTLTGPTIALGERALNGMALIFHELTTNAVKYGALTSDHGHIAINWMENNEGAVEIFWREDGGREIAEQPELNGFGSKLLRDAITRQFGGKLEKTWDRRGLRAQITIPLKSLTR